MAETSLHTNRLAIVSLSFALLTLMSFCIGWAPFLLGSSIICYPVAILLGAAALVSGVMALRQMRGSGEAGRWMALSGVILGGLTVFATLCAITLTLSAIATFIAQALNEAKP